MKKLLGIFLACCLVCALSGVVYADLKDGLVAYYPFDGNANDESNNGHNGTVYGATPANDRFGQPNKAYHFDGLNDYIDCGNGDSLRISGAITLSVWVQANVLYAINQGIVGKWSGVSPALQCSYGLSIDNQQVSDNSTLPNTPMVHISPSGNGFPGGCNLVAGGTPLTIGVWYHIVGIFVPGDSITIYVNGSLDAIITDSIVPSIFDSTQNLIIGNQWNLADPNTYFNGLIDDIRIYNRALSEEEIYTLSEKNPCPGDLDRDGDVDSSDLVTFAKDFGRNNCETEIVATWIGDEVNGQADSWGFMFSCNDLDIINPQDEEWYRGTFTLNKMADPDQIDYHITGCSNPENVGKSSLGIYELDGSTLTVAFGEPGAHERPSNFTPVAGEIRVFELNK